MIVLTEDSTKQLYRDMQASMFRVVVDSPAEVINVTFEHVEEYEFDIIAFPQMFDILNDKFKVNSPSFCITTALVDEPIFLFHLEDLKWEEYWAVMMQQDSIGLRVMSDPQQGLYITNEKI